MSDNSAFVLIAGVLLAAHIAVLLSLIVQRNVVGVLIVDAAIAAAVLAYEVPRWAYIWAAPRDNPSLALISFECLVLVTTVPALSGRRVFQVFAWIAFGLHLCTSAAALVFALTFHFDRLI